MASEGPFELVAGVAGVQLNQPLHIRAYGVIVQNFTAQYVYIPGTGFVPPNTSGSFSLDGTTAASATFLAPPKVAQPTAISGQTCFLTYVDYPLPTTAGPTQSSALASVVTLEKFAKASLPAAGSQGRLVLLTDYNRGVLKDTGTNWADIEGEVFNVKQFGAVGDGVADDQAAIAAAITAMVATTNGGVLLFPPGTYLVSVTPTITDPSQTKRFAVWAHGAVIKTTGAIDGFAVSNAGDAIGGVTICGLTINHQNNATATRGIRLESAGHVSLRDVTVLTGGNVAGYIGINARNLTPASNATGCPWGHMLDCTVRRVTGADPVSAFGVVLEGGSNQWVIEGGLIEADVAVKVRNQSAGTSTSPNSVTVREVDITGTTDCINLDVTGSSSLVTPALFRAINCRAEAAASTFLRLVGMTTNNVITEWAPLLMNNDLVSITTYIVAPAGIVVVGLDWGNTIGGATNQFKGRVCRFRFVTNAVLNVTNSVAGTYVDFGGTFTQSVDVLTGDQVCIRVQSVIRKSVGGFMDIVIDRGGTKLPAAGGGSSVEVAAVGTVFPFLLEFWDTPAVGTYTYKPQVYSSDNNASAVGMGVACQMVIEVWR